MLKKTITYTDYNGTVRKEDFHFNLTKAEVLQMEMGTVGGMQQMLEKIISSQDTARLVEVFEDIILRSYGEKSADGKHFVKNKEVVEAFKQTEAYSVLFMELVTDADAASKFINGIIPQEMAEQIEQMKENGEYEDKVKSLLPE